MPRRREGEPGGTSGPESDGTAGTSPAILKALWVLRALRIAEKDMGVADIARTVELPMTTVHRILKTLVVAGYVVQNAETEQYHLGREAFLLGRAVADTLGFDTALPLLEHLSTTTGESVNLVVRDGNQGLVVLRIESDQPLRYIQPVGTTIPLYCTSSGKALLAFSADPAAAVDRLGELEALTPRTITSPLKLVEELHAIQERLFSVNRGERIAGVCGIAAPVLGSDGVAVAALAVQGPEFRIPDTRIAEIGPLVISAAQAIAATLPRGFQL